MTELQKMIAWVAAATPLTAGDRSRASQPETTPLKLRGPWSPRALAWLIWSFENKVLRQCTCYLRDPSFPIGPSKTSGQGVELRMKDIKLNAQTLSSQTSPALLDARSASNNF